MAMDETDRSSVAGETSSPKYGSASLPDTGSAAPSESSETVSSEDDGNKSRPSLLVRWYPALRFDYFRWYLAGHLLSVVGGWMQDAGLRWYVQTLTKEIGSERWLGLTAAVASLPILIFSPIGGAMADRWSRRTVIAATQTAGMVIAILLGILVWMNLLPLWGVMIFAALHGTFLAFDIPARQAFAIEMVGPRDLMSAIGLNSTIFNLGRLVGPMCAATVMLSGGLIIGALVWVGINPSSLPSEAYAGISACFILNGFSFVGLVIVLVFMKLPRMQGIHDAPRRGPQRFREVLGGFHAILERPMALGLMSTLGIFLLAGGSYPTLLPALAGNVLNTSEEGYGALLTANGLGSVVGALVVASIHSIRSRRAPILAGLGLVSGGLIATAYSTSLLLAQISLFITGIGFIMFLASANSTIQLGVPDEVRGRVMSMWVLTFGVGLPIGSLVAGTIAQQIGTPNTLLLQGIGSIPAILLAAYVLTRFDKDELSDSPAS